MEGLSLGGLDVYSAGGILAVAIPFIVQQIKKLKFIGNKNAPILAFILGLAGGLAGYFTGFAPEGMSLIQSIVSGIAVGGTSSGLYDVAKKVGT